MENTHKHIHTQEGNYLFASHTHTHTRKGKELKQGNASETH